MTTYLLLALTDDGQAFILDVPRPAHSAWKSVIPSAPAPTAARSARSRSLVTQSKFANWSPPMANWQPGDEAITTTDGERVTLLQPSVFDCYTGPALAGSAADGRLWDVRLSVKTKPSDSVVFKVRECNMRPIQQQQQAQYTIHPNGGVIAKSSKRCMQSITVRGAGSYIEITQGADHLLVSEAQLQWMLDAIGRAKRYLKWSEPAPVAAERRCDCGLPSGRYSSPWCCSECANYSHSRGYGSDCTVHRAVDVVKPPEQGGAK